ncbi:MAG: thioredoxin family protein [SAR202 cluster bacterium]|nr:thioredoxin family protein [SAR202 cluster bacterium]
MLLGACGGSPPSTGLTPSPADEAHTSVRLEPILATKLLRVGTQRVAFILASDASLITAPIATVHSSRAGDPRFETVTAIFHPWPYGTRGSYATEMTFPRSGDWALGIEVVVAGVTRQVALSIEVAESVGVREIGAIVPFSASKTLASVRGDLKKLTTAFEPDPELYRLTIPEAIITGKPTVVVFASPAYCTSPTCGPEVETLSTLRQRHQSSAHFIHVEIYDNPDEIAGDLSRARHSPLLDDWGITSIPGYANESWTFVIVPGGRIAARFEGYATIDEIEAALAAANG